MNYAFLTDADVLSRIRAEHLNDIVDRTDASSEPLSAAVELSCESMAIAKMKSALNGRYNVAALFPVPPTDPDPDTRNPLLVLHALNIFVYLIYRRINPRKIPEEVKLDHEETLEWLAKVAAGKENPDFPAVELPDISSTVPRVGGGRRLGGHYY